MRYQVRHVTTHHYATTVLFSQQAIRLTPRATARQRCLSWSMTVEPDGAGEEEDDYFGNHVVYRAIETPHRVLTVTAESTVEVDPPRPLPSASPVWEAVRDSLRNDVEIGEFVYDSPFASVSDELAAYARRSFPAGRSVVAAALDLNRRIHADFTYDTAATTVGTGLGEVMAMRRGVCQDFAHLEIAALRSMGLASRYVGGYLLTRPPPGQPKRIGADASHAWASVWVPDYGWLDLDPTNDLVVGDEHVTCAIGRDFEDVSPIRGVVVGGAEHALGVAVDVIPLED